MQAYARDGDHASSTQRPAAGFLRIAVRAGAPKRTPHRRRAGNERERETEEAREHFRGSATFPKEMPSLPQPPSWARRRMGDAEIDMDGANYQERSLDDRDDVQRRRRGDERRRQRTAADDEASQSKRLCWSEVTD